MLNTNNPIPLYKQLYHQLREQIEAGDYQVGEKLPSVRELAANCGISRLTARKAIELLEQDGCVHVQHGRGIFVVPSEESGAPISRGSLVVLMDTDGVTPEQRTVCVDTVIADEVLAKRLRIRTGTKVIRFERIRFAGDIPVSLDVSWLPYDLCTDNECDAPDDITGVAD